MAGNTCRDLLEELGEFIDGRAPLSRRLVMRWHLARCGDCRRYRKQLLTVVAAAREGGGDVDTDRVLQNVLEAIAGRHGRADERAR